ncbi:MULTISPECIES: ABC transporter permease [Methanobacterium]|jgi:putative ABC transport system permease protein|uniref:ABC transporter permease n=1 Tax=Methanobacterium veterum TaxID=408577 RepID=A0A9E5A1X0_9EURY|nr:MULTISPECIES: ABC transporter permease [Methanobacterium]MCZ3366600.1 ABC transporter permease [Methanobacterium veterum]MCZ3374256.1 ABC transporter permease [Methanobacterium veterum]
MSIYKLSFKNFKRRKLRSALTMLGIVIGVTALISLIGIGTGMSSYMKDQTASLMGDVTITNSSGGSGITGSTGDSFLNTAAVSQIENMSDLYNIKKETQFTTQMNNIQVMVIGMSDWNQLKFNGTPGVVISKSLADELNYKIGSNITVKNQKMSVTGITNEGGDNGAYVFMNVDKALPLNSNKVSSITANTKADPDTVKNQIESAVNGTSALTKSDYTKQIDNIMQTVTLFVGAIAGVALLVGVISIINIMLVNVSERTREIGVLKAIGFKNREILSSILTEAGLLGLLSAIVGVVVAAVILELGIMFLAPQYGISGIKLTQMLPLWLVAAVIGGATILSVLAGLYPAWRASKLNVVEALRYE